VFRTGSYQGLEQTLPKLVNPQQAPLMAGPRLVAMRLSERDLADMGLTRLDGGAEAILAGLASRPGLGLWHAWAIQKRTPAPRGLRQLRRPFTRGTAAVA
jgi:hypothetical protein